MEADHISLLLEPFLDGPLSEAKLHYISIYIDLLLRWNTRVNLTAIRDPEEIVSRHFGESLFLARHVLTDGNSSSMQVFDIGSGAGFPGLPLKIWNPAISLTLIESNQKKTAFLREVIRTLTLKDVKVIAARAETVVGTHPKSDVVTFRAVERFETVLPTAISLVAPSGRLALLIGSAQRPALASIEPGLRWLPPIPVPQSQSRVLSISIPQVG